MQLYLLGAFQALGSGGSDIAFRSDTERALLAYLAVESDRPHRRESLVALFWPEAPPDQARNNLRVSLHRLKQAVDPGGPDPEYLITSRNEIRIRPENAMWVDYLQLIEAIERSLRHPHDRTDTCPVCTTELFAVAGLYRGEFLEGFSLEENESFENWVRNRREEAHRAILDAWFDLGEHALAIGDPLEAESYARRQLELEPWREKAHRQLMTALALSDERPEALAQYGIYVEVLQAELGVAPSPEMETLYRRIREGDLEGLRDPAGPAAVGNVPVEDSPGVDEIETGLPRGRNPAGLGWIFLAGVLLIVALAGARRITDSLFYDRFSDSSFDGGVDPERWIFPQAGASDDCAVRQVSGELLFTAGEDPLCVLRVRSPGTARGAELGSLEADFYSEDPASGAFGVALRFSASFTEGDWSIDCGLSVEPENIAVVYIVSDTRVRENNGLLVMRSVPVELGSWYNIRLDIDPLSMESVCSVGGEEIGRYAPRNPALFGSAEFVRELLPWESPDVVGEIRVDDFRFAPPSDSGLP